MVRRIWEACSALSVQLVQGWFLFHNDRSEHFADVPSLSKPAADEHSPWALSLGLEASCVPNPPPTQIWAWVSLHLSPSLFLPILSLPGPWWPRLPSVTLHTSYPNFTVSFHPVSCSWCLCARELSLQWGRIKTLFMPLFIYFLNLRALDRCRG